MRKLYAVYLGGKADGANIEVHDMVFLVSENLSQDYDKIKQKWFGNQSSVHIDAVAEILKVSGYIIDCEKSNVISEQKLFFINFGAKSNGKLEELHESGFFVGQNRSEALSKAKSTLLQGQDDIHMDNLYNVDDCINVSDINSINLIKTGDGETEVNIQNVYKKL